MTSFIWKGVPTKFQKNLIKNLMEQSLFIDLKIESEE